MKPCTALLALTLVAGCDPARLHKLVDWTLGCVALDNDEIDEVAAQAPVGTPVLIED